MSVRACGWHLHPCKPAPRGMEQYGNASTYNIERVLYQNVQNSEYYKNNCVKLSTIDELIDEASSPSVLHTTPLESRMLWSLAGVRPPCPSGRRRCIELRLRTRAVIWGWPFHT